MFVFVLIAITMKRLINGEHCLDKLHKNSCFSRELYKLCFQNEDLRPMSEHNNTK